MLAVAKGSCFSGFSRKCLIIGITLSCSEDKAKWLAFGITARRFLDLDIWSHTFTVFPGAGDVAEFFPECRTPL
jgi:hypothetical protein